MGGEKKENKLANKRGRRTANVLMIAGAVLVLAALALFVYNRADSARAGRESAELVEEIEEAWEETGEDTSEAEEEADTLIIDGYECIGVLTIPALELELPVLAQFSYPNLKIAPCLYSGSLADADLVICAHNYDSHFGRLKYLSAGDEIYFTDAGGETSYFTVASVSVYAPTAVEEIKESGYPLTLYTCTYGGKSRVTVMCEEAQ